jgi:hypothetical protein
MKEDSQDAEKPGELAWYVAHTRPRCEKKLAEYCEREGFSVTLPLYKSIKKYPGKIVTFEKPLFPNYLFLRLLPHQRKRVYQSDYVANLLDVPDQKTFQEQLDAILTAARSAEWRATLKKGTANCWCSCASISSASPPA